MPNGGFQNPVKATDQEGILKAVRAALIADMTVFTEDNVTYSLEPEPPPEIFGNFACILSPIEGSFDQPSIDGAGKYLCVEQTGVLVSVWIRSNTDQVGQAKHLLFGLSDDKSKALLRLKKFILQSLAGRLLADPQDGQLIVVEAMAPLHSSVPRMATWERQGSMADLTIGFSTVFQWDLGTSP